MIFPIRCFTCGKVFSCTRETYIALRREMDEKETVEGIIIENKNQILFQRIGLRRYCCREILQTHKELIDIMLLYDQYENQNINDKHYHHQDSEYHNEEEICLDLEQLSINEWHV